ncbi:MAG: hypothetical protein QE271_07960 [Bacteriovoracaceae bacterium]|nr:hypothetical protein [Bacteriovoracaceae bacterium]
MDEQGLLTSKVPRALEIRSTLFGFDLPDLLIIFFNLAITNLVFGGTNFRYSLVWGTTITLALFLYFSKKGKPENYLHHYCEYLISPTYFSAGEHDLSYKPFKRNNNGKHEN